jgi:hypothetical protein
MNIEKSISTFTKKFLDPRFRKLVKAGYVRFDEEGMKLTDAGRYALAYIQLEHDMDSMLTLADERIEEQEKEAKKA